MRYLKLWMCAFDHKQHLGKKIALAICLFWFKMFSLYQGMKKLEKGMSLFPANNAHKSRALLFLIFPTRMCTRGIFLMSK